MGMMISARVTKAALSFLDEQVAQGHFVSRSAALSEALTLWRDHRLGSMYGEARSDAYTDWDVTVADGLVGDITP
jgi:Arc/MetJ-type ribon-helix-helix transcriptional regulator